MSFQVAIFVSLILMGVISVITYMVAKRGSNRVRKYIPAIASAFGTVFFYIKLNFIPYEAHAFEGINDVIAIIILGSIFAISILGAIIIEVGTKRNSLQ